MFGISERRERAEQARLVREVRMLLARRMDRRAGEGGATVDDRLGEMLEEVVICGQVLAQVGALAPSELETLDRIHRALLDECSARVPRLRGVADQHRR